MAVLLLALGCQNGPMSGRMQQYQLENERLLSEFRAQKRENDQLRADRNRLLQQQAETEKLAAKLQSQLNSGRTANGSNSSRFDGGSFALKDSPLNGSPRTPSGSGTPGLPNDSRESSPRSATNPAQLQWRPIRKENR